MPQKTQEKEFLRNFLCERSFEEMKVCKKKKKKKKRMTNIFKKCIILWGMCSV